MTVAIASVGRPEALRNSIAHIRRQSDPPEEVLVVSQRQDTATHKVILESGATLVQVDRPGLAHAIEIAIASSTSEVVAFVDDDAEAFVDWVATIRAKFATNPELGFVGGRDNVDADASSGDAALPVGVIRNGRIIGNHHLGLGEASTVLHVKGANMSVRRAPAARVPLAEFVQGSGAQARNELILCLGIGYQGFVGEYDPSLQVNHYPASRANGDERTRYNKARTQLIRHNETVALILYSKTPTVAAFLLRSLLVGDRICCGLGFGILLGARGDRRALSRLVGSVSGLASGIWFAASVGSHRLKSAT